MSEEVSPTEGAGQEGQVDQGTPLQHGTEPTSDEGAPDAGAASESPSEDAPPEAEAGEQN